MIWGLRSFLAEALQRGRGTLAHRREASREQLAARWGGQVARRDATRVARRLVPQGVSRRSVVNSVVTVKNSHLVGQGRCHSDVVHDEQSVTPLK